MFLIVAIIGIVISIYAMFVDFKFDKNEEYKAVCDINDRVSCSKAFQSKYGSVLGVKNSVLGLLFYVFVAVLYFLDLTMLMKIFSGLAVLGSIVLAYLLYAKVKSWCVVCTGIYVVNVLLFIFSIV